LNPVATAPGSELVDPKEALIRELQKLRNTNHDH
jgi:hypothetical protein